MKIVVDAMGGDHAPNVVVEGTIEAVREYDVDIVLSGDENKIKELLKKFKYSGNRIDIHPTFEVIGMSEPPAVSIRKKRGSSIVQGINLIKNKKADAFFSAGNTGAVVCAATLTLGLLPGIERPGIAIVAPTLKGISLIIDVGANIDPKPTHLLQYGLMGDAYLRYILNRPNPTVGLLNIGEEESKGTDFMKETHNLLSSSHLNFIGNLEGKDLFSGKCDIVICDGFVGNIALKVSESLAEAMFVFLKRQLTSNLIGKMGAWFLRANFMRFKSEMDYSEYGGAPLLGVDGIVFIGHGRSNSKAIKNAIGLVKEEVERNFNEKILEEIRGL